MNVPDDILLHICLYVSSKDDLYNLLVAIRVEERYDEICNYIVSHYVQQLLPNNDIELFLDVTEYPEGAYPDELFPEVNTNGYTKFCSSMIKEYL